MGVNDGWDEVFVRLKQVERERDEARAEVARLRAESRAEVERLREALWAIAAGFDTITGSVDDAQAALEKEAQR